MPLAVFAANVGSSVGQITAAVPEGTPQYYSAGYQPTQATQTFDSKTIVGQRTYTYQVPSTPPQYLPTNQQYSTTGPTAVGIGMPTLPDWIISADYGRQFANFEFKTGVNSILKWNDMLLNTINLNVQHNFSVKDYDLFINAEYGYGKVAGGGMSMDYDLKPYDASQPDVGIFTISMGNLAGTTQYMRAGFGAKNIFDIGGWKFSPSVGYEMFKHNLTMSDHIYPNPGIYLPLMTQYGDYIFGTTDNSTGNSSYVAVPQGSTPPAGYYQVCMSPGDILVQPSSGPGQAPQQVCDPATGICTLVTPIQYDPFTMTDAAGNSFAWGVPADSCVVIGGDGAIVVPGVTHIYNTTWSGIYIGLEIEKQMTFKDKLRFYAQAGLPNYSSQGIWPNRTDWQQNPSFIDEGSNGAYDYQAEMEYIYSISDRVQLSIKADTSYFYVGKIGGKLFIAEYTTYNVDANGNPIYDSSTGAPSLTTVPAHTETVSESLKYAVWQSFGLHIGIKYTF